MPEQPIAGRYELVEELNSGGMGDVWRGYDAVLDRPVAVKVVRRQSVAGSPQLAEEFAKRFKREARITARIQHPGVPQVFDAVLDDTDTTYERLFLVMELVDGIPLSAYIHPDRPLPVSWAVAVAAQVATVLSYAHDVPVIHRDLKPGNILVARDGTVKVLDFGIAAILRTDVTKLTATGSPIGRVDPNAALPGPVVVPEQLREEIAEAYAHSDALLEEERFTQAAEVLGEIIEPAAHALGAENRKVLELRTQRAAIRLLGGDYRAALPEHVRWISSPRLSTRWESEPSSPNPTATSISTLPAKAARRLPRAVPRTPSPASR
ncbi:serine/threonine-protein kinase [Streptomyces sp. NPDC060035]|uniref:serine/threonine-protein kinase n=1 Tax=Streptomyces sp. NPDC060035 TaxID=3347044 RepID=UPI0036A7B199